MIVSEIAGALNERATSHPFGRFQELRSRARGRRARTQSIFSQATVFDDYAFHDGGRHEMQFNIGIEERNGSPGLRYGVAFSLEPSRSYPDLSELLPKIERFNHYLRTHPSDFPGCSIWHWADGGRSEEALPGPIQPAVAVVGNFVFLGRWVLSADVDLETILDTFWELLPLYLFVEAGSLIPLTDRPHKPFRPGCGSRRIVTTASRVQGVLDVALRHNELELSLYETLCSAYGRENVATEYCLECGGLVDAVVCDANGFAFYEIKVAPSARCALREAIGQLLEYAHWPDAFRAVRLVVVGEAPLDDEARSYLDNLRRRYGINIGYASLDVATGDLDERA